MIHQRMNSWFMLLSLPTHLKSAYQISKLKHWSTHGLVKSQSQLAKSKF